MRQKHFILFFVLLIVLALANLPEFCAIRTVKKSSAIKVMPGHNCCSTKAHNLKKTKDNSFTCGTANDSYQRHGMDPQGFCACQTNGTKNACHHCSHGCHCDFMAITPLFLPARPGLYIPLIYDNQEQIVFIPLRLPAGFDFIWRPPKIGSRISI